MIFIIPIILGAAALGSAALGVVKGSEGIGKINEAKQIGDRAQKRYESAVSKLKENWEDTNRLAEVYGQLQMRVKQGVIGRFVAFVERIGQKASQSDLKFLGSLDISVEQIQEYKTTALEAQKFLNGGAQAVLTGMAAGQAATTLATTVGVAGTGAAISGLSGAAAWNATLAWLGGGSLVSGGGGMALGTVVLGGITVGPALAVSGFVLAGKGEEALTKAREYKAKVNTEIAKLEAIGDFLQQVQVRIKELDKLVNSLESRAIENLDDLESHSFDRTRDAGKFQQAALLVKAIAEIIKTPVLDNEGNLNSASVSVQAKYRTL
jgi:hypothetical protein